MKYQIELEQKKTMFVTAKNKTEARQKAKAKLKTQGNMYFKVKYIEENEFGFFM